MTYYLHASPVGVGIFDEKGKIVELLDLSLDKLNSLLKGNVPNEITTLQKKYPEAKNIDVKIDQEVLSNVLDSLKKSQNFDKFYDANMKITAEKLRSLSMKDFIVCQSINNIDETDKVLNILTTRLREWYSIYNPELSKNVEDNRQFSLSVLEEVKKKDSIGGKISQRDLEPIFSLAEKINSLFVFIDEQEVYLKEVMISYCPNLSAVATEMIGARLIALTGSLKRLSLFPSSTIQTLGAEKAMFRHLKTGDRPPKYGIIVLHPMINSQKRQDKGKVARSLASKISIAAKIDYFSGSELEGYKMVEQMEKNLIELAKKPARKPVENPKKESFENGFKQETKREQKDNPQKESRRDFKKGFKRGFRDERSLGDERASANRPFKKPNFKKNTPNVDKSELRKKSRQNSDSDNAPVFKFNPNAGRNSKRNKKNRR